MASFVIHSIVGERFLSELETKYNIKISEEDKKSFLLGNLIVDSISVDPVPPSNLNQEQLAEFYYQRRKNVQKEKVLTHFRDTTKKELCIRVPEDEWFAKKYPELLTYDYSTLGYLFHLYTDRIFFGDLFVASFEFLDKKGNPTIYDKETETIRIIKNGRTSTVKDFWNGENKLSIYNDYTIMNKLLLEYYGTDFDYQALIEFAAHSFVNPGIEEVDYKRIDDVLRKTASFIKESYQITDNELSVFEENIVKEFIENLPTAFMLKYKNIVDLFGNTPDINQRKLNKVKDWFHDIC